MLREQANQKVGGGMALVLGGTGVSLVSAWVIVVLIWLWFGLGGLGFKLWLLIVCVLFAGAAFAWLRVRDGLLVRRSFEYRDPQQEWTLPGPFGNAMTVPGTALDYLFIGPRMILAGIHEATQREAPSRERFYDRCALLLRQIGRAGEAVPLARVRVGEDETQQKLEPVLGYLDRRGWIGLNSARDRVWLSTRAKEQLMPLGVVGVPGSA